MKKLFSLFCAVLFSVTMFAKDPIYKITGGNGNLTGWGTWDNMEVSDDGLYEYFKAAAGDCSFKISKTGSYSDALGEYNNQPGFNSTDIGVDGGVGTTWTDGDHNANYWYDVNDYYILIYYEGTEVNSTEAPIICASTILPDNRTKYYITGSESLTGLSGNWNPKAITATEDSYTFESLAAGEYKLVVLTDGTWDTQKGYTDLTSTTEGLSKESESSNNIMFTLAETANVTVTYNESVFTITSTVPFYTIDDGYYLIGVFGGESKWTVTDLSAEKKFTVNKYIGNNNNEYKINTTLAVGDEFKAVYVGNNALGTIYPAGDSYKVLSSEQAGDVTIYFRIDYSGTTWDCNFYVEKSDATALDNTEVEAKAVKTLKDGMLLIEKDGKTYNVLGTQVR